MQGAGFRVQDAGCRVQSAGCRVQGSGFRVQGAGCRVQGLGFNRLEREAFDQLGKLLPRVRHPRWKPCKKN